MENKAFRLYPHGWTVNSIDRLNELFKDGWTVKMAIPENDKNNCTTLILERKITVK